MVKNTDPNNLTSSAEAIFGKVSTILPRVVEVNRSDQNEEVNGNYSIQNENCMRRNVRQRFDVNQQRTGLALGKFKPFKYEK